MARSGLDQSGVGSIGAERSSIGVDWIRWSGVDPHWSGEELVRCGLDSMEQNGAQLEWSGARLT
eukprot:5909348-Pleurochrysis_carterae.AAC.1